MYSKSSQQNLLACTSVRGSCQLFAGCLSGTCTFFFHLLIFDFAQLLLMCVHVYDFFQLVRQLNAAAASSSSMVTISSSEEVVVHCCLLEEKLNKN